jgi:hypothetical protein
MRYAQLFPSAGAAARGSQNKADRVIFLHCVLMRYF